MLSAKLVAYSFADGIDLDFEHLTPFANMTGDKEYAAFAALILKLRSEFDKVEVIHGLLHQCTPYCINTHSAI